MCRHTYTDIMRTYADSHETSVNYAYASCKFYQAIFPSPAWEPGYEAKHYAGQQSFMTATAVMTSIQWIMLLRWDLLCNNCDQDYFVVIPDIKLTLAKISLSICMFSCVTMVYKSPYSHSIVDLIRSYSRMTRLSPLRSMDNQRQYHWIDLRQLM